MNKQELKIQALLERISKLTTEYESRVADLRVELTVIAQEKDELQRRLNETMDKDVDVQEEGKYLPEE